MMRSLLYVPGISERMILKARDSAADGLILDLEDGVAPNQKLEARATVVRLLSEIDFGGKEIFVRVNALATEWGLEDARSVAAVGAPGLVIPKCESVEDITTIAPVMQSRYHQPIGGQSRKLLCLIETPRGVFASREIADSNELIAGLMFGAADLSRDLGAVLSEDETEVLFARSHVLLAARAAGIAAYDSPHFAIEDIEGLRRRCQAARNLGYDGKTAIHPTHIETINDIFAPTAEQIAEARRVIEAMEAAQAEGLGAIRLDGKMIDQVHLSAAKKVLEKARKAKTKAW
ncbi:MAG: CoA ester lyase [Chloracidobacterium sp.]|nr:CoA ester lyase [Chloracidobacterium sp.]